MRQRISKHIWALVVFTAALMLLGVVYAQESGMDSSNYSDDIGADNASSSG